MHKVAVVGDRDSVLGFRALGVHVYIAYEANETRKIVDSIAKEDYGVIFITEQLANLIPETIDRYNSEITPAVILIPSNQGTLGIGMKNINKNVEKAVGSNIL
ncbi:V-type ATP synthase subunit F [Miniphocaeibacter massiliensis]|uniref:V-type ATP synthase subunit F n=1 Tax=Miniphocaeibacter massiliensis TaxID=2041841 RepID=UPI000C076DD7|nr:V-type ATP synthase subunit F [Miniphocaeibacter massiliensis]